MQVFQLNLPISIPIQDFTIPDPTPNRVYSTLITSVNGPLENLLLWYILCAQVKYTSNGTFLRTYWRHVSTVTWAMVSWVKSVTVARGSRAQCVAIVRTMWSVCALRLSVKQWWPVFTPSNNRTQRLTHLSRCTANKITCRWWHRIEIQEA